MRSTQKLLMSGLILAPCLMGFNAHAANVEVKNNSGNAVTLTDFISYANANNTGAATVHLKNKDATDDLNIAAGGKKSFDVGAAKSWTVSWNNSAGKEVETDTRLPVVPITAKDLVMFDSNFNGAYGLAYDFSAMGALPTIGSTLMIDHTGHPMGMGFGWITFYDLSNSGTGLIERDANGVATSPYLPHGTYVTASFPWSVSAVPEPSTLSMLTLGLGALALRKRRKE